MLLTAGTRPGRYEIRAQLGAGGMAEVYPAEDRKLRRKVAIKLLPPGAGEGLRAEVRGQR